jgi:hypothetical protein
MLVFHKTRGKPGPVKHPPASQKGLYCMELVIHLFLKVKVNL